VLPPSRVIGRTTGTSQSYRFTRVIVIDLEKRKAIGLVLKAIIPAANEPPVRQPA